MLGQDSSAAAPILSGSSRYSMSSANCRMVRPGWREEAPIPGRSMATIRMLPTGGKHPKRSCPKPAKKTMGMPSGGSIFCVGEVTAAWESQNALSKVHEDDRKARSCGPSGPSARVCVGSRKG
jgi:hypothetical protein